MRSILLTALVAAFFVSVTFAFNQERDCKCRVQASKRIIGGRVADQLSYPWQISISLKDSVPLPDFLRRLLPEKIKLSKHNCGGSILNERWILTAAHCVPPKGSEMEIEKHFQIGYSSNDLVRIYNKRLYMEIEDAIIHPGFNFVPTESGAGRAINDIALIKLKSPLKFSSTVQPACLGIEHQELYDGIMKMSGWGSTTDIVIDPLTGEGTEPVISRYLKEGDADDSSATLELCVDTQQNICVDSKKTKDTACKGDSGGPLHANHAGKASVVGIASFVDIELTDENKVRVCLGSAAYTRVSSFKAFIEKHVHDEYCA